MDLQSFSSQQKPTPNGRYVKASSSSPSKRHGWRRNTTMTVTSASCWYVLLVVVTILCCSSLSVTTAQQDEDGTTTTTTGTSSSVCLMLYQMADNDLEYFIRLDNLELIQSPGIQQRNLNTWIYFDHRNYNLGGSGSGTTTTTTTANDDDDTTRATDVITEPLPMVYQKDGSDVPADSFKPMGSQYLHYDHTLNKMVIDRTLEGEQDGDSPLTLQTFLEVAMTDCIEQYQLDQQQSTTIDASNNVFYTNDTPLEYVLIFASHGSGWLGFGGDENKSRRRRKLIQQQSNVDIVNAIRTALGNVVNAPSKLDVIGFDACNMQGVGTVDDYQNVSKYFLASESVEPAHGWAYNELSNVDNAMSLALNLHWSYLQSKHGYDEHKTPKTLAIVDTDRYPEFLQAWNALSVVLTSLLTDPNTGYDPDLYVLLNRARFNAVSFETVLDDLGTPQPSAVDVGSFLNDLFLQCDPIPGHASSLRTFLMLANSTYHGMFIARGVGEGTVPATGMHVEWPVKEEYDQYQSYYNSVLLDDTSGSNPHVTVDATEWLQFLRTYYAYNMGGDASSTTGRASNGDTLSSVCRSAATSDGIGPSDDGRLLINPSVSSITVTGGHEVITGLARETQAILIEYGINLTPLLHNQDSRRRLLRHGDNNVESPIINRQQVHPESFTNGFENLHHHRVLSESMVERTNQPSNNNLHRRYLKGSSGDYLLHFGGNLAGSYDQMSRYSAFWDRTFFVLKESVTGRVEDIYVSDLGSGSRQVPVIYIPPSSISNSNWGSPPITSVDIEKLRFSSLQEATTALNGEWAYLSFSSGSNSGSTTSNEFLVSLYTSSKSSNGGGNNNNNDESDNESGGSTTTFRETPPFVGGQIVPFVYVDGKLDGTRYSMMIGGYQSTVLDWNENNPLVVQQVDATTYVQGFGVSDLYIDIVAAANTPSEDGGETIGDYAYFVIGPDNQVQQGGQVLSSSGGTIRFGILVMVVVTATVVVVTFAT